MPRGAAVIRYEGPRGVSWRVKYVDADGRQVKETLGREPEWDRRKAERALGARLVDVDRGMRKPRRRTFDDLANEFLEVTLPAKPRKKSTVVDYKATIRNHLRPRFGTHDLARLSQSPETIERYAAEKIAAGLSPKRSATVEGRQPARACCERPPAVRQERDHGAEVEGGEENSAARPGRLPGA
jgi:hypothetical protein